MAPVPHETTESPVRPTVADPAALARVVGSGFLSWIVPGLGHLYIGERVRGIVCMVTIVVTFWSGVAIGGVRATIDPHERSLWFLAQACTAGNAGLAYLLRGDAPRVSRGVTASQVAAMAGPWVSADIGVHYTGVAGLLNLLVILDSMGRAERLSRGGGRRNDHPPGAT